MNRVTRALAQQVEAQGARLVSSATLIGDAMQDHASDNQYEPSDYVSAGLHLRAAAAATTAEQHAWNLELGLSPLRRSGVPKVLDAARRDDLRLDLIAAYEISMRLFKGRYSDVQIELGYRAAHGVLDGWAIPLDEGRRGPVYDACGMVLGMFLFDVVNMRRADDLDRRLRGAAIDTVLPPLPRSPSAAPCVVVPFPGLRHDR